MSDAFHREAVQYTPEFRRIDAMPRRVWAPKEIEALTDRMTALLKTPQGTQRLRPIQAVALYEIGTYGGLLGPISVGAGKELLCFLASKVLFAKHPILLMPAHLVKRSEREMQEYSVHWRIPTNLRILSFQMLGQASRASALSVAGLVHDVFVINEAHRLKNKNAAVTRRVVRHMAQFPNAKVIAVSGTMLSKSVMDFAHIARWCVKPCPLPNSFTELQEWSDALDEKPSNWNQREPGALLELCSPEERKHPPLTAARMGFRRRLTETPGIVATEGGDDVANAQGDPIQLTVRAISYEQDPIVEQHFKKLREEWATPSGWQFSIAMGVWRHARTLALGFHYEQVDTKVWGECLRELEIRSKTKSAIGNIEQQIERHSLPSTRPEQTTPNGGRQLGSGTDRSDTESLRLNSTPFATNSTAGATSVSSTSSERGSGDSASTTTTKPKLFEEFFVSPVTGQSVVLGTMLQEYAELFNMCLERSRPPIEWMLARSTWKKFVREQIKNSRGDQVLDSELQVTNACLKGTLDDAAFNTWRQIAPSYTPSSRAVWHDDAALLRCQKWMAEGPGIVFTDHTFFAEELARRTGARYFGAGGIDKTGLEIEKADPNTCVIASRVANSTGRNLQAWNRGLVTSSPHNALEYEQLLGRFHRHGQKKDVIFDVLVGCVENYDGWVRSLDLARMTKDTLGASQKLLIARTEFPSAWEMGLKQGFKWQTTKERS